MCLYLFILIFFIVEEEGAEVKVFFSSYTYDLRTTLAVRGAGGCLTAKKGAWCGAVFVDLFHFLLLFYCS